MNKFGRTLYHQSSVLRHKGGIDGDTLMPNYQRSIPSHKVMDR